MAIRFPHRFFNQHRVRPVRVILWVEELEFRQVLSAVGPFSLSVLHALKQNASALTPALTAPTSTGTATTSTPAPFIVNSGAPSQSSNSTPPQTLQVQTPNTAANVSLPPTGATFNQLPPILQGSTIVPPAGSLTLADVRSITENFLRGVHPETTNPTVQSSDSSNTPRPTPTPTPMEPTLILEDTPESITAAEPLPTPEAMVPAALDLEAGPLLITDPSEEFLRGVDGQVDLRVQPSAAPVLVASLAALWADRHRRPEEEENADTGNVQVLGSP